MGKLTADIPKPMIEVGGMPVLEHQIKLLRRYGIQDIYMLAGYLSHIVENYFQDGSRHGVHISYFVEDEPLGTAGCLKAIEDQLTDDFFVLFGDIMVNMDLQRLARFHDSNRSACTLVLHPNDHPFDSDLVEIR